MVTNSRLQRPVIDVAAAVIRDSRRRLLLSQRPEGKHLAGRWEFPGGKREPGESAHEALVRELHEELGIEVADSRPLMSLTHHYPEKSVRLLIRTVDAFSGQVEGREGQRVDWFELEEVGSLPMPEADRPILRLLHLDARLVILSIPTATRSIDAIVAAWQARLDAGFKLLCLNPEGLDAETTKALAEPCAALARRAGAHWLIDGQSEWVAPFGAQGLHLRSEQAARYTQRPVGSESILAISCRDDQDLRHAARLEADVACLSLTSKSESHHWQEFATRVAASPLPIVARGLGPSDLTRAREVGAFGVAFDESVIEEGIST